MRGLLLQEVGFSQDREVQKFRERRGWFAKPFSRVLPDIQSPGPLGSSARKVGGGEGHPRRAESRKGPQFITAPLKITGRLTGPPWPGG